MIQTIGRKMSVNSKKKKKNQYCRGGQYNEVSIEKVPLDFSITIVFGICLKNWAKQNFFMYN